MSEADYMDDCQMFDLAEEHHRIGVTHEVTIRGEVVFEGSREECWIFKRRNGGFVARIGERE